MEKSPFNHFLAYSPHNPHTLPIRADCWGFVFFLLFSSNLCVLLHELISNPSDSVRDDSERWNPANERILPLVYTLETHAKKKKAEEEET